MSGTNNAKVCVKHADTCVNPSQNNVVPNVNRHPIIQSQSQMTFLGDKRLVTPTRASISSVTPDNMQVGAKPTHMSRWQSYVKQSTNLFPYSTDTNEHLDMNVKNNPSESMINTLSHHKTNDCMDNDVNLLTSGLVDTSDVTPVCINIHSAGETRKSVVNPNTNANPRRLPNYPKQPPTMLNKDYCWLKAQFDCDNGFTTESDPDNVTDLLFEESCAAGKGSKAVEIIRTKYLDFALNLNTVDLRQLVAGRVKIDKYVMARQLFKERLPRSNLVCKTVHDIDSNTKEVLKKGCDETPLSSKSPCAHINDDVLSISSDSDNSQEEVISDMKCPTDIIPTTCIKRPCQHNPSADTNYNQLSLSSDSEESQEENINKNKCPTDIITVTDTDYVHINNCYPHYYHSWLQSGKSVDVIGDYFNQSDWLKE